MLSTWISEGEVHHGGTQGNGETKRMGGTVLTVQQRHWFITAASAAVISEVENRKPIAVTSAAEAAHIFLCPCMYR